MTFASYDKRGIPSPAARIAEQQRQAGQTETPTSSRAKDSEDPFDTAGYRQRRAAHRNRAEFPGLPADPAKQQEFLERMRQKAGQ